ncbi:hypothetical protein [Streptomyces abyssomicinicus]|uniref:hypothetical protein n=1 Tax=Streptomyces abyssomicinicus TaxID=574929 RepID=UPI00350E3C4C
MARLPAVRLTGAPATGAPSTGPVPALRDPDVFTVPGTGASCSGPPGRSFPAGASSGADAFAALPRPAVLLTAFFVPARPSASAAGVRGPASGSAGGASGEPSSAAAFRAAVAAFLAGARPPGAFRAAAPPVPVPAGAAGLPAGAAALPAGGFRVVVARLDRGFASEAFPAPPVADTPAASWAAAAAAVPDADSRSAVFLATMAAAPHML